MIGLSLMTILAPAMAPEIAATVRYGTISCRSVKDAALEPCPIALVPKGEGKIAAYVTFKDGRQRILYFRDGMPASTDGGGRMEVRREGDVIAVNAGTAEAFELPSELVSGN